MTDIKAYLPLMFWPDSDGGEGAALRDPGAIIVHESESDDECIATLSLANLVQDFVSALSYVGSGTIEDVYGIALARKFSAHLRDLADSVDEAISTDHKIIKSCAQCGLRFHAPRIGVRSCSVACAIQLRSLRRKH